MPIEERAFTRLLRRVDLLERLASRKGHAAHLSETVVYTASDTFSKADYPGLQAVLVRVQAGGGGGGGSQGHTSNQAEAGCGGGGGYSEKLILASALSASESVTVGAGGSGGAAGNDAGAAGGNSSFGSHATANGGGFGAGGATSVNNVSQGGLGGTAASGDINIAGGDGENGRVIDSIALLMGVSGASVLGGQRKTSGAVNQNGLVGRGFGAGGSGAISSTADQSGGDGAPGVVIVEVYV